MTRFAALRWMCGLLQLCALCGLGQPSPPRAARPGLEFPLELKQKIVAGQTAVGTAVEGRLVIATFVHGVVIPDGAVFTGRVEESTARSEGKPSRLRLHVTGAKWRGGSAVVDLYLTNVFYPRRLRRDDPHEGDASTVSARQQEMIILRGNGGVPPILDQDAPTIGNQFERRIPIEDVKIERDKSGLIAITSEKSNVHLDSGTVYCFEGTAAK